MKKSLFAILFSAAIAGASMVHAQDASPSPSASPGGDNQGGGHRPPGGGHHFELFSANLLRDLQLTTDQKAQVKSIFEAARQQGGQSGTQGGQEQANQSSQGGQGGKGGRGHHQPGEMKEILTQIRAILTAPQQTLLDDFVKYAEDRKALHQQGGDQDENGQSSASPSPSASVTQ